MKISPLWFRAAVIVMGAHLLPAATRTPVLLELFTSEGCSSCPPADALLEELDRSQPFASSELVVLSEHVDYWNQLGWKDPYSSAIFSARQNEYAGHLSSPDVYTPELIVDGTWQVIGSDRAAIRHAVNKASVQPKQPIGVEANLNGSSGTVHVTISPVLGTGKADVYVALAKNHVISYVAHGENAHRTLSHTSVAYRLTKLGSMESGARFEKQLSVELTPSSDGQTRVIVFAQDPRTGRIIALTQTII
ncbi:MAG TPA: DUF1223 domain-containing protein [Bryobacteraceae bacterium]|jgi:hypothetical protein|nr:DUF1223 domain-containing protein [Bryobacteraceae bacterium]